MERIRSSPSRKLFGINIIRCNIGIQQNRIQIACRIILIDNNIVSVTATEKIGILAGFTIKLIIPRAAVQRVVTRAPV